MIRINGVDVESTLNQNTEASQGTYVLADNPNLYEPQRSNNFDFIVTGLDNIIRAGTNGDEAGAVIVNAQETLRIAVNSAFVPHFTQEILSLNRGNDTIKYAGKITFPEGQFIINDYIGADTKSILMAWQNLSGNVKTEKVGHASDYKKDAYLVEYTPDYTTVRRWVLKGCWISGISEGEYNHDNNELRKVTATIQYDKAYIDTSELT